MGTDWRPPSIVSLIDKRGRRARPANAPNPLTRPFTSPLLILGLALCPIASLASSPASAAPVDRAADRVDRIDRQLDRASRPAPAPQPPIPLPKGLIGTATKSPEVTFTLQAPVAWTNNASYDENDGTSAIHFSPAAQVKAVKYFKRVTLEGRASVGTDVYSRAKENNLSFTQLRFQLSLPDAGPLGMTPYLRYQPRVEFSDAGFGKYADTLHDFSVGLTRDIGKITSIDVYVRRRESPTPEIEMYRPGIDISFQGDFKNKHWSWSLDQAVEGRFYTGGSNRKRSDVYSSTEATIGWKPKANSPFALNLLDVVLEWNQSNFAGKDYVVLNVGLGFTATF
jgi:hypothetical protein